MPATAPTVRPGVAFVQRLAEFGDADAIVLHDRVLSYADLAEQVAAAVAQLGPVRRLLLIAATNELPPLVHYLAALQAGHPVLLVPGDRDATVDAQVAAYEPDLTYRRRDGAWTLEIRHDEPAHELHPDLAVLLTTSGSTGSPKTVRLSHDNLQANAEAIATSLGITSSDRAATTLPISYSYGLSVVHSHLLRGAALILTDLSVVDSCFWDLFRSARATTLPGVPYTFDLLDRVGFDAMSLPHLRCVTQAGGRLAPERVKRYAESGQRRGWDFFVMYGQTEATARMAYLPPELAASHPTAVGVPVPGGAFSLEPVEDGVGELVYTGPNVMLGYAESAADLRLGRTVTCLRTGDLARRCSDGLYEVVGRAARFAKVFGQRIDLEHVESMLGRRGLTACCVDSGAGQLLVAVEADPRHQSRVRRDVATACGLPPRAVQVAAVTALPRVPCGKPDLRAVAALAAQPGPTERKPLGLTALFADVLGRQDVDEDSTFVSLGGDSLSYVEMSVRLEQELGHLPRSWHTMAIRDLAGSSEPASTPHPRVLETSIALRALAILLIVGTHANLFDLSGGSHVLLGIAGFNIARFCLSAGDRRQRLRHLLTSVTRVVVPSVAFIAFAYVVTDNYSAANVALLNGVIGPDTWSSQWHFWFIEALVYLSLALAALLALPGADRLERRYPFGVPLALLGVGLLARFFLHSSDNAIHTATGVLWLFALGWAAARARTWQQRLLLTAVLVTCTPGYFTDARRGLFVVLGLAVLVWLPTVRSTAMVSRVAGVLASSSLYVYLTHWLVYPRWEDSAPLVALAASFLVGIAYWRLVAHTSHKFGGHMRIRGKAAAALVLALLATTACGSGDGKSASSEDGLVVYSGRNEKLIKPLLEMFTAASGVKVSVKYGGSAELAAQLLEEGDKTPAAVFLSQDAGALGALQDASLLEALPQAELDKVSNEFRSKSGSWVGVSGRARVLVYNSDQVKEADLPKSVFDLAGPAYKGKIGLAPTNASFQSFVTGMRVTQGAAKTKQFLTALKANEPKSYESNVVVVDAVNKGEVSVGLVNHYYLYEKAAEAGGLDKLTARNHFFPNGDPGALVNVAGVGVLKGRGDARSAKLVDFLLSAPAQKYFAEQTFEYPLAAGVAANAQLPPLAGIENPDIDLSQLDTLDATLKLLDEVGLT